ncbi:MAG: peptide chain release factor 2 [Candidatus Levybacteria bacterium CG10_big_fil_rev_8_21_14_0_10_35_13]|nr:MAG: peptide chain release factor 2 [Candidatus Levybacteria bacterium CG10_big_fil_rev_8_21_14_0_10_35_13]
MENIRKRAKIFLEKIEIEGKKKKIAEIEAQSLDPDFWKDTVDASSKMQELSNLQKVLEEARELENLLNQQKLSEAEKLLNKLENLLYLSGKYDKKSAILSIHSGQGGVEAMDWANMLYRMYSKFFDKKGWKYDIVEVTPGEEAGIKSIVLSVSGSYVYGFLRHEAGVHRLVRQSPFNADNLRQTSFALVEVMPDIEDSIDLEIKDEDLDWDFYRSGGHGGQNVNKVSTAVRLKHKPSGLIVSAQAQRYQGQNREYALKILRAKLWLLKEEERKKEEQKLKGGYKTPGWGNQIRSYVLHPYRMVKDLRTGYEESNAEAVLDGSIDGFIDEELRKL